MSQTVAAAADDEKVKSVLVVLRTLLMLALRKSSAVRWIALDLFVSSTNKVFKTSKTGPTSLVNDL